LHPIGGVEGVEANVSFGRYLVDPASHLDCDFRLDSIGLLSRSSSFASLSMRAQLLPVRMNALKLADHVLPCQGAAGVDENGDGDAYPALRRSVGE
jgi:hypothetical protein